MPSFLYYLPGLGTNLAGYDLIARDLGHLVDGPRGRTVRECLQGPDGTSGVVVAAGEAEVGYFADRQTWRKIPQRQAAGKAADGPSAFRLPPSPFPPAWVGYWNDALPAPEDLVRREPLAGHWVELADGRRWLVPVARSYSEQEDGSLRWEPAVPCPWDLDGEGRWVRGSVPERYRQFFDLVARWDEARCQAAAAAAAEDGAEKDKIRCEFTFGDLLESAVAVLQQNYRVGRLELCLLGALTDAACLKILDAAADGPTRLAWYEQKKTALAGGGTGGGG